MSSEHLNPGDTCPQCDRRVPYPKKETSPQTRTVSKRVPVDELAAHEQVARAAAEHLGVHDRPHWRYALDTYAYALVLQDESLRGIGARYAA